MLTFEQLQTFRAIIDAKTFTRAADDLLLTQPAISQRIRRFEEELGVEIFDRRTRGREVTLTAAGERVLRFADEVLGLLAQLQQDIEREKSARQHEIVHLACDPWPVKSLIPSLLATFHARYPDIRVHLVHCPADKINAAVTDGDAEVGVQLSTRVTPKFEATPFWRDQMVLLAPPSHPVFAEPWRRATHIAESGFVLTTSGHSRHVADEWAATQGITLDVVLESQNLDMVKEAVIRGLGLTILPELWVTTDVQEGRLAIVPVEGLPRAFESCLIIRGDRQPSRAARALLEVAREGSWRSLMPGWKPAQESVTSA